ncbi:MAG TPA: Xaa-Pro peptidase family protein [Candidatus Dormibacteraeota bacterium]|nr:Xaa-Pro peptidase family protein [Candidatus Dormibacteraeota bacterium]
MEERGLDAVLLSGPENQYYVTGYETTGFHSFPQTLILPRSAPPVLVTRRLEEGNAAAAYQLACRSYRDDQDPADALAVALRDLGLADKPLGVEKAVPWLTVRLFEGLRQALPRATLIDVSGLVELQRAVKSPAEIAYMRQAAVAVAAGMGAGLAAIRDGANEREIAAVVFPARILAGSHFVRNPTYITAGPRSALAHATWLGKTLARGDVVFLEMGANVRHYDAALIRTAIVGPPSEPLRRAADASLAGLAAAIAAVHAGIPASEVYRATRDAVAKEGCEQFFLHRAGYGIGIEFLTWIERGGVSLDAGSPTILQPNMTLHLVPYLLLPGLGSVGFSETVRVTETGCEVLTRCPRALTEA